MSKVANTKRRIAQAVEELERVQQGQQVRLLQASDVQLAVDLYNGAARRASRLGVTESARAVVDGGAVMQTYGAPARTTRITVSTNGIKVERVKARTSRHGTEGLLLCACRCPRGRTAKTSGIPHARKYAGELYW